MRRRRRTRRRKKEGRRKPRQDVGPSRAFALRTRAARRGVASDALRNALVSSRRTLMASAFLVSVRAPRHPGPDDSLFSRHTAPRLTRTRKIAINYSRRQTSAFRDALRSPSRAATRFVVSRNFCLSLLPNSPSAACVLLRHTFVALIQSAFIFHALWPVATFAKSCDAHATACHWMTHQRRRLHFVLMLICFAYRLRP